MGKKDYWVTALLSVAILTSVWLILSDAHNFTPEYSPPPELDLEDNSYPYLDDPERLQQALSSAQESALSKLGTLQSSNQFTNEQENIVNRLIEDSLSEEKEYAAQLSAGNATAANTSLYLSYWYAHHARQVGGYFEYETCVEQVNSLGERYRPLVHSLRTQDVETINKLNADQRRYWYVLEHNKRPPSDPAAVVSNIRGYSDARVEMVENTHECHSFAAHLKNDVRYSHGILVLRTLALLLLIGAAFLLGKATSSKRLRQWTKKIDGETKPGEEFWAPKASVESVKAILQVSSVTSVIATAAGIVVTVLGSRGFVLLSIPIFCVFALLGSILLGVRAINAESARLRLYSYRLFIIGMLLFIVVLAEILFIMGAAVFGSAAKEAINAYLTINITGG